MIKFVKYLLTEEKMRTRAGLYQSIYFACFFAAKQNFPKGK